MNLIIKINLDNATFEHQPGNEVSHILERLAASFWGVASNKWILEEWRQPPHNIFDSNGNTVGTVEAKNE